MSPAGQTTRRQLSPDLQKKLRCPRCLANLRADGEWISCVGVECGRRYPRVDGIPILVDEERSVFSVRDFVNRHSTTFDLQPGAAVRVFEAVSGVLPDISRSWGGRRNYRLFRDLLLTLSERPRVLVVGGSVLGRGMEELAGDERLELVGSDVSLGPETSLISDAHQIPFDDQTFDGVILQAVLEHVLDPQRCVQEASRVLRAGGLVYAETPFMQQIHMGRYDFTRFTHSGHRWLFRDFSEVASGLVCGPGMALAWSYQYFLLSFTTSRSLRALLRLFARLTSFYLTFFDAYLIDKTGAIDAASGFYFIGRKDGRGLSGRELIEYYRGALSRA